jgi:hypothetical protein
MSPIYSSIKQDGCAPQESPATDFKQVHPVEASPYIFHMAAPSKRIIEKYTQIFETCRLR